MSQDLKPNGASVIEQMRQRRLVQGRNQQQLLSKMQSPYQPMHQDHSTFSGIAAVKIQRKLMA
jgi:hypothetical protein